MKPRLRALALLMCCSALNACGEKRVQVPIPIPADKIDCADLDRDRDGKPIRPTIPKEYVIDWSRVTTPGQARAEHEAFVTRLRERERPTAGYIVQIEGRVFACADDAGWVRDYLSRLPAAQTSR